MVLWQLAHIYQLIHLHEVSFIIQFSVGHWKIFKFWLVNISGCHRSELLACPSHNTRNASIDDVPQSVYITRLQTRYSGYHWTSIVGWAHRGMCLSLSTYVFDIIEVCVWRRFSCSSLNLYYGRADDAGAILKSLRFWLSDHHCLQVKLMAATTLSGGIQCRFFDLEKSNLLVSIDLAISH